MPASRIRHVHQLLGALHRGDAVGNEALAIRGHLRAAGFVSEIFAGRVDPRLAGEARSLREHAEIDGPDAACLYHFSPGSPAGERALAARGPLVLVYHNVTPARFFAGYSSEAASLALRSGEELRRLAPRTSLALAKSVFSLRDLEAAGFERRGILPFVLAPEARLDRSAPVAGEAARLGSTSSAVIRKLYADGRVNVLSVGRLVPNKRVEELLSSFAVLQRRLLPESRLLLVGDGSLASYADALERRVHDLGLRQVVFLGHVEEDELRACYEVASVYVSLSEHEGYGVPLVEAMLARVPVLARDAGAVRETMAGAGVLVREPAAELVAELVAQLAQAGPLRTAVLAGQERVAGRVQATDFGSLLRAALAPVLEAS